MKNFSRGRVLKLMSIPAVIMFYSAAYAQSGQQCAASERQQVSSLSSAITTRENVTLPPEQLAQAIDKIKPLLAKRLDLIAQVTQICAAPCRADAQEEMDAQSDIAKLVKQISRADQEDADTSLLYQQKADAQKLAYAWARQRNLDCRSADSSLNGSGSIRPAFMPLFVIYAPPGANGGKGVSTADYGAGSSLETNLSTTQSYTDDLKVSFGFSGGAFGDDATLTLNEDHSVSTSDSTSADIKETVTDSIHVLGPSADGIDHDYDRIYVLLNPEIVLTTTNVGTTWSLKTDGNPAKIQYATVGQLKGTQQMPMGVKMDFDAVGLTLSEYSKLLAIDPFANGAMTIDTNRFLLLPTSIPYDPPPTSTALPGSVTHIVSDSEQDTRKASVDTSNSIGVTVGASVDSPFAKMKLSVGFEFTYKYSNSIAQTTGTSQSIGFSIGQPAYGYAGPVDIYVYKDSIFDTYLFSLTPPPDQSLLVFGRIIDITGKPVKDVPVQLKVGSGSFISSVSGVDGFYRLMGKKIQSATNATLTIATLNTKIKLGAKAIEHNIKLATSLVP